MQAPTSVRGHQLCAELHSSTCSATFYRSCLRPCLGLQAPLPHSSTHARTHTLPSTHHPPHPPHHIPLFPPHSLSEATKRLAAKRILSRVSEAYGRMLLLDGLFQADGHPGNILVMKGGKEGGVVGVDTGGCGMKSRQ